jgi:hypothetical protein
MIATSPSRTSRLDPPHHPLRVVHQHAGPTILTTLCAACPHGAKGCCVVPPRLALADIARIVRHGGRDWLLGELQTGRIVAMGAWMILTRPADAGACVYLSERGCTIANERRPATCNFYVCESALGAGGESADVARSTRDQEESDYAQWDALLARLANERAPQGIVFDAATLDFLATELP